MKYFLAHNEIDVFHYGELSEEQVVTTGQPNLEHYNDLDSLIQRLNSFGVQYIEDNGHIIDNLDLLEMGDPI
jgi:hypothetical protein